MKGSAVEADRPELKAKLLVVVPEILHGHISQWQMLHTWCQNLKYSPLLPFAHLEVEKIASDARN